MCIGSSTEFASSVALVLYAAASSCILSVALESVDECHDGRRNRPMFAHPLGANLLEVAFNAAMVALASMLFDSLSRLPDDAYRRVEIFEDGNGRKTLCVPWLLSLPCLHR